ncbi:M48 family metalloprotease [Listeria welshimeri]|nr:M48 family metalloprotease [Listeria monocytogenes]MBC1341880.1 M48 family metalloprotease [Listeria welshimeri]EEO9088805.1 M48 family metalloprotease [Listeria monocytogenes]MBC1342959.1 M48 family metalloprotease [Listeria welshimeri]MBC1347142.1 M48 family metalloprotease [Listeria welshimeri]
MEIRKSKFNYVYIIWALLTIMIALIIIKKILAIPLLVAMIIIAVLFIGVFVLNYGLFGDWRNRINFGLKKPATLNEVNGLNSINEEVFQQVNSFYPKVKKAELFVIAENGVNAYALGQNTIGITKGALASLNIGELKAVIAHEYGHLANRDTLNLILFNTSFTILSISLIPLYFISFFIGLTLAFIEGMLSGKSSVSSSLLNVVTKIVRWSYLKYYELGFYFVNLGSRDFEFRADEVAAKAGYGKELLSFFYILEKTDRDVRKGFLSLLASTHPYTSYRIQNIEKFLGISDSVNEIEYHNYSKLID